MPEETKPAAEPAATPAKKKPKTMIMIIAVAVAEAIAFIVVFQFIGGGGPKATYGQEGEHYVEAEHAATQPACSEVPLLQKFRVPNGNSGRLFIYDLDIVVKVPADRKEHVELLVEERNGEICDSIARIVRGADPRVLSEPDLKTLRLQIQHALREITEDAKLIEAVLIPRCVPFRSE